VVLSTLTNSLSNVDCTVHLRLAGGESEISEEDSEEEEGEEEEAVTVDRDGGGAPSCFRSICFCKIVVDVVSEYRVGLSAGQ
jgi:hypothetical protein